MENRPHGPTTGIMPGEGGLAEPRDTLRSRGRLGWDTWREKRAHPYANAAVPRTTKQAHAHGECTPVRQFLCPSLRDSTPRAVRRGRVQSLQWCSLNTSHTSTVCFNDADEYRFSSSIRFTSGETFPIPVNKHLLLLALSIHLYHHFSSNKQMSVNKIRHACTYHNVIVSLYRIKF